MHAALCARSLLRSVVSQTLKTANEPCECPACAQVIKKQSLKKQQRKTSIKVRSAFSALAASGLNAAGMHDSRVSVRTASVMRTNLRLSLLGHARLAEACAAHVSRPIVWCAHHSSFAAIAAARRGALPHGGARNGPIFVPVLARVVPDGCESPLTGVSCLPVRMPSAPDYNSDRWKCRGMSCKELHWARPT